MDIKAVEAIQKCNLKKSTMCAYESVETYAKFTHMSLEQAKIRYEHFIEIKKQMQESRKCPKCHKHTLAIEYGEWESGVSDWIYCENDEECDFTDDVKKNTYSLSK